MEINSEPPVKFIRSIFLSIQNRQIWDTPNWHECDWSNHVVICIFR